MAQPNDSHRMLRIELEINQGLRDESESLLPVRPKAKNANEAQWAFGHTLTCHDGCGECTELVHEFRKYRRDLAAHVRRCARYPPEWKERIGGCLLCDEADRLERLYAGIALSELGK